MRDEPTFAAIAVKTTAFRKSTFAILEIVNMRGMNMNIAVSFIIIADEIAVNMIVMLRSLSSESLENSNILKEILFSIPESSSPLEIISRERIVAKLS